MVVHETLVHDNNERLASTKSLYHSSRAYSGRAISTRQHVMSERYLRVK